MNFPLYPYKEINTMTLLNTNKMKDYRKECNECL
nr:MAG TPA: hypothetical protein [Caudoviricetes sp.]